MTIIGVKKPSAEAYERLQQAAKRAVLNAERKQVIFELDGMKHLVTYDPSNLQIIEILSSE